MPPALRLTDLLGGWFRSEKAMDYHLLTKKCDGMCDSCECPPARNDLVTCGGGLPGDPNGEQAALAVEVLVRKYEGAMLRETLREALTEAYMMGAQNILGRL